MSIENTRSGYNEEEAQYSLMYEDNSSSIIAFRDIPYSLISSEIKNDTTNTIAEMTQIKRYYNIYDKGVKFNIEGTNGDYVPAKLMYKMAASLINKEARFLFAETPDITIDSKGDAGKVSKEAKDAITNLQSLIKDVLDKNMFENMLIKGAKDCFIGKRIAGLVNFNEYEGITVTFLPSTQFLFETLPTNKNKLSKFVCFMTIEDSLSNIDKRIFKKKYTLEEDGVYVEESIYDGAGTLVEEVLPKSKIELDEIPAVIFVNDGLLGDCRGESEIELLKDFEKWYSKLSNADIDAQRKSMNPTKYTVDMDNNSTKGLKTSPGALWDLGTDQNLDNAHPMIGILEPDMSYSDPLKITLDRIKTVGYEQVDMPNVTLETMIGSITSGKALKAIYWPLITRCKEKMKMWGPNIRKMIDIIIEGAMKYPDVAKLHIDESLVPVSYEVKVTQNLPLPEDEQEEKQLDIAEVEAKVMSKKAYMKKWRGLTDDEVNEELDQIAIERQIIEDSSYDEL